MSHNLLGHVVVDKASGLVGVVTGLSQHISRQAQALVQPPAKDGDKPKGLWIDVDILRDRGSTDIQPASPDAMTLSLGDKVRHFYSDWEGFIVDQITYVNGCVHFGVIRAKVNDDGHVNTAYFDQKEWTLIKNGNQISAGATCGGPDREHWG